MRHLERSGGARSPLGRASALWAACTALVVACLSRAGGLALAQPVALSSFSDRAMGQAVSSGVDVSGVVGGYYGLLALLLVALVAALCASALLSRWAGAGPFAEGGDAARFERASLEYGLVCAFLGGWALVTGAELVPLALCYLGCTLHLVLAALSRRLGAPSYELTSGALLALFPLGVFLLTSVSLAQGALTGTLCASVALAVALVGGCVALFLGPYRRDADRFSAALARAGVPLLASCAANPVLLELKNVLVARGVIAAGRPFAVYALLTACCGAAGLVILARDARGDRRAPDAGIWRRRAAALLVVSVVLSAWQPPVTVEYGTEYFESSNHGVALDALFRRGEVPLVESFDAHMLMRELTGILYYLLNPYEPWGYLVYQLLVNVPLTLVLYLALSRVLPARAAALWTVASPALLLTAGSRYLLPSLAYAVVALLALWAAVRRPSAPRYALLWLSVALLCLLGLDSGLAGIVATAVTLALVWAQDRSRVRWGRAAATGVAVAAGFLLLWVAVCALKGIDPVGRLAEFVSTAASNANWATWPVADVSSVAFGVYYLVIPAVVLLALVAHVVSSRSREAFRRGGMVAATWVAFAFFAVFYLANLSRGVVRHNLAEGNVAVLLSTSGLAALSLVLHRGLASGEDGVRSFGRFVAASGVVTLLFLLPVSEGVDYATRFESAASLALEQWASTDAYKTDPEPGSRVTGSSRVDETLVGLLDATLAEGETFLDLSGSGYLYAVTGRESPLYVNQAPAMISGDSGQLRALAQIEEADPALVLMPSSAGTAIDGLDTCLKYYRLFERVYEGYEPLARIDGASYDVWCRAGERDRLLEALSEALPEGSWAAVEGYDPLPGPGLGLVPLVWAELDERGAWDQPVEAEAGVELPRALGAGESLGLGLPEGVGARPAYLALTVDASSDATMALTIGAGAQERAVSFGVGAGEHRYLVRVSAYYQWWESASPALSVEASAPVSIVDAAVLAGD